MLKILIELTNLNLTNLLKKIKYTKRLTIQRFKISTYLSINIKNFLKCTSQNEFDQFNFKLRSKQ